MNIPPFVACHDTVQRADRSLFQVQTTHETLYHPSHFCTTLHHALSKTYCLDNFIHPHYIRHDEFGQCQKQEYLSNFGVVKATVSVVNMAAIPLSVAVFGSVARIIARQKACSIHFTKRNIMAALRTFNIPIALLNRVSVDG